MKKLYFLTLALLVSTVAAVSAGDCCPSVCEPCGPDPLHECSYGLQFHAGIVPTVWADRDCLLGVNCDNECGSPIKALSQSPKFSDLFKLPWTVGGRVTHNRSACEELYLEFNYIQASAKEFCLGLNQCEDARSLTICHDKYKAYNGYFGARQYYGRYWCDRLALFAGLKVGFIHHKGIDATVSCQEGWCPCSDDCAPACAPACNTPCWDDSCSFSCPSNDCDRPRCDANQLFDSNTTISAGGELGLDICLTNNFSFLFSVGFLGNGALKPGKLSLRDQDCSGYSDLLVPCFSTEVQFPIHFGLKYNF